MTCNKINRGEAWILFNDKLYSPEMVVTIYNKIYNENDLTKKSKGKNKTNGIYLSKLVMTPNM